MTSEVVLIVWQSRLSAPQRRLQRREKASASNLLALAFTNPKAATKTLHPLTHLGEPIAQTTHLAQLHP